MSSLTVVPFLVCLMVSSGRMGCLRQDPIFPAFSRLPCSGLVHVDGTVALGERTLYFGVLLGISWHLLLWA